MSDILLAHSYFLRFDSKQREKVQPYPPLATLYAASALREAGYSVALFDAMLSAGEHEFEDAVRREKPRFVALYEDSFNFLSKMCLSRMREAAQRMARFASASGAKVIAAGPDVTDHPEQYLANKVDYALAGEGDRSLCELIAALDSGEPEISVSGVRSSDTCGATGLNLQRRPPERNLDSLPMPAWDLVDIERYRAAWMEAHGRFSLNMVTSRGCPFRCNWCAKPIWGQRYSVRSARSVAEELAYLKQRFSPDHIWFADDIFGLRANWLEQFVEEVTSRDAAIPYTIQSRADLITARSAEALAASGCREVWIGAESGSQKILDAMEKGITVEQIGKARALLKTSGIRVGFFLQLGYPGETLDDILATVQLVRRTVPDTIGVSVSYPLPGT
ncbi:MAG TPA: radical SAM protein, partial [Chthonomonadales bacterium]|nr:radical SAM protein [Chthonomonadales bacterium]